MEPANDKAKAAPETAPVPPIKPVPVAAHAAEGRAAAHTPRETSEAVSLPPTDAAAAEEEAKKEPARAPLIALRFNKKSAIWNFREEGTSEQPATVNSATATPTPGGRHTGGSKTASAARPKTKGDSSAIASATRANAATLADVLRAHREQQSAAGPVQSTTVVKKEKKQPGAPSTKGSATKKTPKPEKTAAADEKDTLQAAPTPQITAEPAPSAEAVVEKSEESKKESKKTPKKTGSAVAHVAVARKKSKTKPAQSAAAATAGPAPPVVITTVKADKTIEQMRALRSRGAAAVAAEEEDEDTSAAAAEVRRANQEKAARTQGVVDEITDLLLSYCRGEDRATAVSSVAEDKEAGTDAIRNKDGASEAQAEESAAGEKKNDGDTVPAEALASASAYLGASAEVQLYEKLVQLCQREEVTPATLELIRELVQHTRVIPQASRHHASAESAVTSRRREYVQQIILVLLNQLKQQKMAEEAYGVPYAVSSMRSSPAAPRSFMPSPMAPMVDQSAALIAAATNRITLFNPQFSVGAAGPIPTVQMATPLSTPKHTLKATATPFVPASLRGAASDESAAPQIPSLTPSPSVGLTDSPSRGGLAVNNVPAIAPSPFPGAFPIVMGSAATPSAVPITSTTAAAVPVTLSAAERDVLRTVQQSFHQQHQYQQTSFGAPRNGPSEIVSPGQPADKSPLLRRTPGHNESTSTLAASQEEGMPCRGGGTSAAHHTVFCKRKESALFNASTATESTTANSSHTPSPVGNAATATGSAAPTASLLSMNVNAPAFVPGGGVAVPDFAPAAPAASAAVGAADQPWASNEMFAEFKKMMDTYTQAQTLMRSIKKQQQLLALAGKSAEDTQRTEN